MNRQRSEMTSAVRDNPALERFEFQAGARRAEADRAAACCAKSAVASGKIRAQSSRRFVHLEAEEASTA